MSIWRRGSWLAGIVGALLPSAGLAQSLEQALEQAYWNNPTLRAERSAVAAADHGIAEALSAWRPTVTTSLGRSRSYIKAHDNDDYRYTGILPSQSAGITLSQRIADFGQTTGAVRAAEARVLGRRAVLSDTEQTVLLETAQTHLDVVRAEAGLELNRANIQVLRRQLAAAEAGFARQMSTQTDVAQATARLANAQAELRQAEEALDNARGRYVALVGEAPTDPRFPATLPSLPEREAALARAQADNPKVLSATYAVEAARAAVEAAEAVLRPTISFEASDSYQTNSSVSLNDQRVQSLGLVVRMPLYQSGAEYARMQARKQELGQQRLLLDAARRSARQNAVEAWNALEAARARLASYQSSVAANQIAQQGVNAAYLRLGSRTLLDVLNAEQELFQARINLLGARRDEAAATYQVIAATGRMTAEALSLAVVRYDPVRHYDQVRESWFGWGDDAVSAGEHGPGGGG